MTRLAAEKPVEATIMLVNSFERSTLLSSSEPDAESALQRSSWSGPVIFGDAAVRAPAA